jgi:hypothetical protein
MPHCAGWGGGGGLRGVIELKNIVHCSEPVFVNVYGANESIPPACVDWRAGTTNRVIVPARQAGNRFLGSLKGLQIRAQYHRMARGTYENIGGPLSFWTFLPISSFGSPA